MKLMDLLKKTKHVLTFTGKHWKGLLLILLFFPIYSLIFNWLEKRTLVTWHVISFPLDHLIPFEEIFILPYLFWFVYIVYSIAFLFFKKNSMNFYLMLTELCFGMSLFLLISYVWPNALDLRTDPATLPRKNIFTFMVIGLWETDTPTNVFPSIHVFNSLACHHGLCQTGWYKKHPAHKWVSFVLLVLIILSTMFIKQHSICDIIAATVLHFCFVPLIYRTTIFRRIYHLYDKEHTAAAPACLGLTE